jgi:hypothetical protein
MMLAGLVGAFGVKGVIRMTQAGNPSYQVPWEGWSSIDKRSGSEHLLDVVEAASDDGPSSEGTAVAPTAAAPGEGPGAAATGGEPRDPELSTILVGPWLDTWEVVHENKHTRAWKALTAAQKQQSSLAVP